MRRLVARRPDAGMVLLGVMVALALAALVAANTGQRLADSRQRDLEEELLYVGDQYRQAIESYWRNSPGPLRTLPTQLDDLVQDNRFPTPRRHLRRAYDDPLLPGAPPTLIRQGQAIVGVYSEAPGTPFRQTGFTDAQRNFDDAKSYADWRFLAKVSQAASAPAAPALNPNAPPGARPLPPPSNNRGLK